MKFNGRWTWCDLCNCAKIRCSECGNTSCNGNGCDKCYVDFIEATRMLNNGLAPNKEEVLADLKAHQRDEQIVEQLETRFDEIADFLEKRCKNKV